MDFRKGIALADPEYHTPNKIDILLGAEVYGLILEEGVRKGPSGSIIAQNTKLGWILSGLIHSDSQKLCHNAVVNRHISLHTQVEEFENINELLKQFWELESDDLFVNRKKLFSEEEQKCEEFYNNTTKRDADGRYIVKLPFRDEDPQCKYGKSRSIAVKRFRLLEARFKKNPEFKARYAEVIHEYLELGHMERVQKEDTKESEAVYLPHHAVIRDDKATTKIRVVFDASCKGSNGISLNDTLMIGPTLQSDLRHIIMRWRMHPICLSADIVKMYRQVRVSDQDADFQRLVWRDDPASEMEDYRLVRVTFGTASAPYLAVKTLQQLAHDEGMNYFTASEKLINDYYVDDLMTGCQTVEEGLHLYQEMKDLLAKGGFDISKWDTNNEELAREILEEDDNQEGTLDIKIDNIVKILGLFWERTSDNFKYSVQLPPLQEPVTKRKVISDISRLFDPLGWAAPCVITAKVMMQKLWLAGINWDEELPPELLREWKTYRMELISTRELRIPRWIECAASDSEVELHGFCDASNMAYAAVVYLRVVDKTGDVKVNLVTAKTKVAPTKQTSIPRLELLGAVLLARLINEVAEVLSIPRLHVHGWTDSMVVLAWLSGHPSRWTTFVGNRVSEILERMENTQWAHVRSGHNPADIASRGMTPSELSQTSMWGNGPLWLKNRTIDYTRPKTADTDLEQRRIKSHVVTNPPVQYEAVWTKYSSLLKLVRVIAYCKRIFKVRQPNQKMESYLTSQEMAEALEVCIRQCQGKEFEQEIEDIHKTGEVNNGSKLKPLCPFLDEQGILRVGGRLHNADFNENVKHPIIIPPKSHLTNLIVNEAHLKTLHGGPLLMQNHLRSKYWVISAKILTKTHVRKCVICIRHAAATKNQLMGQLPSSRVTPRRPFLHSGVDFAGPINIRVSKGRGNKSYKGYICIFVCMATKAIHLEAISDLTAQGFIAGFKRFVARRGHCSDVWSDNGTNFVGASRELQALVDAEQSSIAIELRTWLSTNNVTWHFIPPHAPNFGGLWEAGVKSAKFHLKRVIGNSTLTYEEMSTVLAQIEACLNSRPLCQISDNINDPTPLTPGHFIVGEPLTIVPEHNYERSNIGNLRRWQVTQRMIQDFWRRWSHEYMLQLLQRYKWAKISPQPKLGDVVLIKEDNLPPARWLLGKIESTQPGLDGVTRVVTLKCNGSLIKRPTSKLCILPVSD